MITLDGSYGEGGGALVRTALALSSLTGKSFEVRKIRAGREKGGLKAQHVACVKALHEICKARTNTVEVGSEILRFVPGRVTSGRYEIDIGTAGSISLVLQAVLPICLFAKRGITLILRGGTCGKWQPSVEYIRGVLFPQLARFVDALEMKVMRRGYFPRGCGEVIVKIKPRLHFASGEELVDSLPFRAAKIDLCKKKELEQVRGQVNVSATLLEAEVAERIVRAGRSILPRDMPTKIESEYAQSSSEGGEIVLWGVCGMDFDNPIILGADALCEKKARSEEVGLQAARRLLKLLDGNASCDVHLADQLILYMGLLPGSSIEVEEVSEHLKTNIYVTEQFLDVGFRIEGKRITCEKKSI